MNSERGVGPQALSFGDFRLDLRRRVLHTSTGQPVALTSRVLDTLVYMVQHPGVLLARDRLMDSIWPDSDVEPNNLSQNVAKLRRVFAEKPGHKRYIETVPGRGYRFIAEVRSESTPGSPSRQAAALHSTNSDATRLFRQALRLLQRPTAHNCRLAIEQLESALALDGAFAPAWAWLADAHLLSVNAGIASPEILNKAEGQATRAKAGPVRTLNLDAAAAFLHMHPEEVRARAKRGLIPGAKTGKRWVFLEMDLAEFVRSLYPLRRQALQVTSQEAVCHLESAVRSGGSTSPPPVVNEYDDLLRPPTRPRRRSCTTS